MLNYTADWWGMLALLVAVVLPILVGLVTRVTTHPGVQAVLLLALSAIAGTLTLALQAHQTNDVNFSWRAAALNSLVTFVIAVASHFGLWKPTTVARKAQLVGAPRAQKRQYQ
jgi:hypothetical protein